MKYCKYKLIIFTFSSYEKVLVLYEKSLSEFSSNFYVLRFFESETNFLRTISQFHFPIELYEIRKNVIIQNCLLQKDLQI